MSIYLEYKQKLYDFYTKYHRMPSYMEMAKLCNVKSKDTAFRIVGQFIKEDILEKDSSGKIIAGTLWRASMLPLKILGIVEAGFPTPAEELESETLSLDDWIVRDRSATFMLSVKGDSMIEAGVLEGDYVIVERTHSASTGDMVIANMNGGWTLKYLRKDKQGYYLEPANKELPLMRPTDGVLEIHARVIAVVRKFEK